MERECLPLTAHRQPELFHVCFGPFALILLVLIRDSNMRHVFQDVHSKGTLNLMILESGTPVQ